MVLVMLMTTDKANSGDLQFPQPQWILGWTSTPGKEDWDEQSPGRGIALKRLSNCGV
jgi:hypothetical protein